MTSSNQPPSDKPGTQIPDNYGLNLPMAQGLQTQQQQPDMDASMMMMMMGSLATGSAPMLSPAGRPSLSASEPPRAGASMKDRNHGLQGPSGYMASSNLVNTNHNAQSTPPNLQAFSAAGLPASLQSLMSLVGANQLQSEKHPQPAPMVQPSMVPAPTPSVQQQPAHTQYPIHGLQHFSGATGTAGPCVQNAKSPSDGAEAAPAVSGLDFAAVDLLMETMDAWEEAVTKRMHSAVQDAIRGARSDVMQIVEAKFMRKDAQIPTPRFPAPAVPVAAQQTPPPQATSASMVNVSQAQIPLPPHPGTLFESGVQHQFHQHQHRPDSTAVPSDGKHAPQRGESMPHHRPTAVGTHGNGVADNSFHQPSMMYKQQRGGQEMSEHMRSQLHAFGSLFVDRLSDSATSAGLSGPAEDQTGNITGLRGPPSRVPPSTGPLSDACTINAQADICKAAAANEAKGILEPHKACISPQIAAEGDSSAVGAGTVANSHDLSAPMVEAAQQLFFVQRTDLQSPCSVADSSSDYTHTAWDACMRSQKAAVETSTGKVEPLPSDTACQGHGSDVVQPTEGKEEQLYECTTAVEVCVGFKDVHVAPLDDTEPGHPPCHGATRSDATGPRHAETTGSAQTQSTTVTNELSQGLQVDNTLPHMHAQNHMHAQPSEQCIDRTHSDAGGTATEEWEATPALLPSDACAEQLQQPEALLVDSKHVSEEMDASSDRLRPPLQHRQRRCPAGAVAECCVAEENSLEIIFSQQQPDRFDTRDQQQQCTALRHQRPCRCTEDLDSQPLFILASKSPAKSAAQEVSTGSSTANPRRGTTPLLFQVSPKQLHQRPKSATAAACSVTTARYALYIDADSPTQHEYSRHHSEPPAQRPRTHIPCSTTAPSRFTDADLHSPPQHTPTERTATGAAAQLSQHAQHALLPHGMFGSPVGSVEQAKQQNKDEVGSDAQSHNPELTGDDVGLRAAESPALTCMASCAIVDEPVPITMEGTASPQLQSICNPTAAEVFSPPQNPDVSTSSVSPKPLKPHQVSQFGRSQERAQYASEQIVSDTFSTSPLPHTQEHASATDITRNEEDIPSCAEGAKTEEGATSRAETTPAAPCLVGDTYNAPTSDWDALGDPTLEQSSPPHPASSSGKYHTIPDGMHSSQCCGAESPRRPLHPVDRSVSSGTQVSAPTDTSADAKDFSTPPRHTSMSPNRIVASPNEPSQPSPKHYQHTRPSTLKENVSHHQVNSSHPSPANSGKGNAMSLSLIPTAAPSRFTQQQEQPATRPPSIPTSPPSHSPPRQHDAQTTFSPQASPTPNVSCHQNVSITPELRPSHLENNDTHPAANCQMGSPSSSPCRMHTNSSTQTRSTAPSSCTSRRKPALRPRDIPKQVPDIPDVHVLHDVTRMQDMQSGGDKHSDALMSACARALESVSGVGGNAAHKVDISKELHALEADVLRACVLGGTGTSEIPWRDIMHPTSHSTCPASLRESYSGSSSVSTAGELCTSLVSLDIDRELACMVKDTLVAVSSSGGGSHNIHRISHRKRQRSHSAAKCTSKRVPDGSAVDSSTRSAREAQLSPQQLQQPHLPFHPLAEVNRRSNDLLSVDDTKLEPHSSNRRSSREALAKAPAGVQMHAWQLIAVATAAACMGSMRAPTSQTKVLKHTVTPGQMHGRQNVNGQQASRPADTCGKGPGGRLVADMNASNACMVSRQGRSRKIPTGGRFQLPEGIARATEKWLASRRPGGVREGVPVMGFGRTNSGTMARSSSAEPSVTGAGRASRRTHRKSRAGPTMASHTATLRRADDVPDLEPVDGSQECAHRSERCQSADACMRTPSRAKQLSPAQRQLEHLRHASPCSGKRLSGHFIPTSPSRTAGASGCYSAPPPQRMHGMPHLHRSQQSSRGKMCLSISHSHSETKHPARSTSVPRRRVARTRSVDSTYSRSCSPCISNRIRNHTPRPPLSPIRDSPTHRGQIPIRRRSHSASPHTTLPNSGNPTPQRSHSPLHTTHAPRSRPSTEHHAVLPARSTAHRGSHVQTRNAISDPTLSLDWQLLPLSAASGRSNHSAPLLNHGHNRHRVREFRPQIQQPQQQLTPRSSLPTSIHSTNTRHGKVGGTSTTAGGVSIDLRAEFAENMRAARALVATAGNTQIMSDSSPPMGQLFQNVNHMHGTAGIYSEAYNPVATPPAAHSPVSAGAVPLCTYGPTVGVGAVGGQSMTQYSNTRSMHEVGSVAVVAPAQGSAREQLWESISAVREDLGRI